MLNFASSLHEWRKTSRNGVDDLKMKQFIVAAGITGGENLDEAAAKVAALRIKFSSLLNDIFGVFSGELLLLKRFEVHPADLPFAPRRRLPPRSGELSFAESLLSPAHGADSHRFGSPVFLSQTLPSLRTGTRTRYGCNCAPPTPSCGDNLCCSFRRRRLSPSALAEAYAQAQRRRSSSLYP